MKKDSIGLDAAIIIENDAIHYNSRKINSNKIGAGLLPCFRTVACLRQRRSCIADPNDASGRDMTCPQR